MPKKKTKLNLDSIFEAIQKKFEEASLEEVAFIASWLAGSYLAFGVLKGIKFGAGMIAVDPTNIGQYTVQLAQPLLDDPTALAISLVASYKFLKSDIDSISAIVNLLK